MIRHTTTLFDVSSTKSSEEVSRNDLPIGIDVHGLARSHLLSVQGDIRHLRRRR